MARQAKGRRVLVFRQDKVGNGGVVRLVAAEAGHRGSIFSKGNVWARDRMSLDGVIELVSLVEVEVEPWSAPLG